MTRMAIIVLSTALLASICAGQSDTGNTVLVSLVNAERAFAAKSIEIGARPAFMMCFADDAMVFRPHPVKYKEAMQHVPPSPNPKEVTLEWEPLWADVSRSADLGYTTGPSVWTDHSPAKRPTYYGFYFSFWKKQTSGEWKVVFDIGAEMPGPYEGSRTFHTPSRVEIKPGAPALTMEKDHLTLIDAEQRFLETARREGTQKAFAENLDNEARIYRQKTWPIVGMDSIQSYFMNEPYLSTWHVLEARVADADDLGYTYGSYTVVRGGKPGPDEKGYFLHGWRRDATNRWRLVAEITSPLPPETPGTKQ